VKQLDRQRKRQLRGSQRPLRADAFAAGSPTSGLAALSIPRREPRPQDVQIENTFVAACCHSDLHQVPPTEWKEVMPTVYPVVAGA